MTKKPVTVLHITPHLGGGVGRVVLNYLDYCRDSSGYKHKVQCLEYANEGAKTSLAKSGIEYSDDMYLNHNALLSEVAAADIVLVHWWNHPLLYSLLVREHFPASRIIFWSHTFGAHAPYVFPPAALNYPDYFVFTTPLSLELPAIKALSEERKKRLRVVWSTGGVERLIKQERVPHDGFNIGYVGTVDYCKMSPDFLEIAREVNIQNAKFIVCGGPSEKEIASEAATAGISEKFTFTGSISNVEEQFSKFDIFGYPLASYHYGTCEQALAEAMAAGIPPVVMNNPTETLMVKDGQTGLVAEDSRGFAECIRMLYNDIVLRKRLGENARKHAAENFSMKKMADSWNRIFEEIIVLSKSDRCWKGTFTGSEAVPHQLFLESIYGSCGQFMDYCNAEDETGRQKIENEIIGLGKESSLWRAATRGTPAHYSKFFPEDGVLAEWSRLLNLR
ncbi:MAG: glycosyltransferase family 4 protein [Fibrobacteres bacterium]|nr:glycosyltransferase family 4 protein [Fibrobacterota bacterium]